jgi:hypothetical protein
MSFGVRLQIIDLYFAWLQLRLYSELIFVESKALKQAHSELRNCFSNAAYRQKSDR